MKTRTLITLASACVSLAGVPTSRAGILDSLSNLGEGVEAVVAGFGNDLLNQPGEGGPQVTMDNLNFTQSATFKDTVDLSLAGLIANRINLIDGTTWDQGKLSQTLNFKGKVTANESLMMFNRVTVAGSHLKNVSISQTATVTAMDLHRSIVMVNQVAIGNARLTKVKLAQKFTAANIVAKNSLINVNSIRIGGKR